MSLNIPFDTTYLNLPARFYSKLDAKPVSAPTLIVFNHRLAAELGLDTSDMSDEDAANLFSGNKIPSNATPFAQVYAGHQFGGFSPQLAMVVRYILVKLPRHLAALTSNSKAQAQRPIHAMETDAHGLAPCCANT